MTEEAFERLKKSVKNIYDGERYAYGETAKAYKRVDRLIATVDAKNEELALIGKLTNVHRASLDLLQKENASLKAKVKELEENSKRISHYWIKENEKLKAELKKIKEERG